MSMEQSKKKGFLRYIHNFRGFAMLLIVGAHSIFYIANSSPREFRFLDVMLEDSSILFLFISGFLFQHLIAKFEYRSYLLRKAKFIILPYIIMSIPAILLFYLRPDFNGGSWILTDSFKSRPLIIQIILLYGTGAHQAQFWFMPMIALFYLISPILKWIDEHPKLYYSIPVLIIISIVVGRPPLNNNTLQSFVYFFPIYLSGMFTSRYFDNIIHLLERYWIIMVSILLLSTASTFFADRVSFLEKFVMCQVVLLGFYKLSSEVVNRILDPIAKYSFGIFFIHKYCLIIIGYLLDKLLLRNVVSSGFIGLFLLFWTIVLLSLVSLVVMKTALKKNSRIITGC